jgi:hypothetical protein
VPYAATSNMMPMAKLSRGAQQNRNSLRKFKLRLTYWGQLIGLVLEDALADFVRSVRDSQPLLRHPLAGVRRDEISLRAGLLPCLAHWCDTTTARSYSCHGVRRFGRVGDPALRKMRFPISAPSLPKKRPQWYKRQLSIAKHTTVSCLAARNIAVR